MYFFSKTYSSHPFLIYMFTLKGVENGAGKKHLSISSRCTTSLHWVLLPQLKVFSITGCWISSVYAWERGGGRHSRIAQSAAVQPECFSLCESCLSPASCFHRAQKSASSSGVVLPWFAVSEISSLLLAPGTKLLTTPASLPCACVRRGPTKSVPIWCRSGLFWCLPA